jgi:hypothetical protein
MASAWQDGINEKIVEFGVRMGSENLYELGIKRQSEQHLKTPQGLRQQMAFNFREATKSQFEELGFVPPAYEIKEVEDERRDAWRLRVEDKAGNRSFEVELVADRIDPKQLNVHAMAWSSLVMLTKSNVLDEWKGSIKTDGDRRLYMEAINAAAMVLSWLDPLAAPEAASI